MENLTAQQLKVLAQEANAAMLSNQRGDRTVAQPDIFPHAWLWDSCFVAIGLRHDYPERAAVELEALVGSQWRNGMIPSIEFNMQPGYFMDRKNWNSRLHPGCHPDKYTSTITQPPMVAEATWLVGEKLTPDRRQEFFGKMLPAIINHHNWLFDQRCLGGSELVSLIHPYESGMDNTPPWLEATRQLRTPSRTILSAPLIGRIANTALNLGRRDTRAVSHNQRMTNDDVLVYQKLISQMRSHNWDINNIYKDPEIPMIEDVGFNAIFARANQRLADIADVLGTKLPHQLTQNIAMHSRALERLWSDNLDTYVSRNTRTQELIPLQTIGSLLMLYTGVTQPARTKKLVKDLTDPNKFWTEHPIPSVPQDSTYYEPQRYWQGSKWHWIDGLVQDGLRRHGQTKLANELAARTLVNTTAQGGFYEYTHPHTGQGLGVNKFSGTAAITRNMIATLESQSPVPNLA